LAYLASSGLQLALKGDISTADSCFLTKCVKEWVDSRVYTAIIANFLLEYAQKTPLFPSIILSIPYITVI
jgi:hypothetical protein